MIEFTKMHGCGNDFIVIDARKQDVSRFLADPEAIKLACNRRFGVGCDQLIVIQNHPSADAEMLIWNPDASVAGMCGNAARCVADTIIKETRKAEITLAVGPRRLKCTSGDMVTVDMGPPHAAGTADVGFDLPQGFTVDVGNPHVVFHVASAEAIKLEDIGPKVENHALFPKRTNVEFISKESADTLRMRVWERGAGVTLACGSGACASAYAAFAQNIMPRKMNVRMDGGTLRMEIRESDGHIIMTGPTATAFKGQLTFK